MFCKSKNRVNELKSMTKDEVIDFVRENYNSSEYFDYNSLDDIAQSIILKTIKNTVMGLGYDMETADMIKTSFHDLKSTNATTIKDVKWTIFDDEE